MFFISACTIQTSANFSDSIILSHWLVTHSKLVRTSPDSIPRGMHHDRIYHSLDFIFSACQLSINAETFNVQNRLDSLLVSGPMELEEVEWKWNIYYCCVTVHWAMYVPVPKVTKFKCLFLKCFWLIWVFLLSYGHNGQDWYKKIGPTSISTKKCQYIVL